MSERTLAPDIERAAATMLSRARANHPVIAAWVRRIIADPSYTDSLDDFSPAVKASEALPAQLADEDDPDSVAFVPQRPVRGRYGQRSWSDLVHDGHLYPHPADDVPKAVDIGWSLVTHLDRAIYVLATKLVLWRRAGRPSGDQTTLFDEGFAITTSLAAAVAEFAIAYAESYGDAYAELRLGPLRDEPDYETTQRPYMSDPRLMSA